MRAGPLFRVVAAGICLMLGFAWVARSEKAPAPAGRETCAVCHDKEAEAFARSVHGRAIASRSRGMFEASCATCHAPAESHMSDPTKANVVRIPAASACLACHASRGSLLLTSPAHARNRVGCLDCHFSGHPAAASAAPSAAPLLLAPARELCARCHETQARSFALPYAHREGVKPFACTACHSVHGSGRGGRLSLVGKGAACADCHAEKAGPYVFPHPPREVEGCLACHQPHGSPNPRLLTRRSAGAACLECHANIPPSHDLSRPRYQNCVTCHVAIHGSNHDRRLMDE
jgi:DmsE family decaheme c-type cytochrome